MRHPLITTLTLLAGLGTSNLANATDAGLDYSRDSLGADEAYILVDMGTRGALKSYVSSLQFNGAELDYSLSVPKAKGVQVMKVKAGTYRPAALGLVSKTRSQREGADRMKSFDDPAAQSKSLVIEPGTVTFIGSWDVAYGRAFSFMDREYIHKDLAYRVRYPMDDLQAYAQENRWVTEFPLRVSHISGKNAIATWPGIGVERLN